MRENGSSITPTITTSGPGSGRDIADPSGSPLAGRGAQRSRAFLHQDVVICLLEVSATNAEKNLAAAGKAELVRMTRDALQHAMAPQLIEIVGRLTERTVRSFLSGSDGSGGSSIEAFVLEPAEYAAALAAVAASR
jgi:uncharacterized protein YbcI